MNKVKILKTKKEVPTVIEYNGRRYVLDNKTPPKEQGRRDDAHH